MLYHNLWYLRGTHYLGMQDIGCWLYPAHWYLWCKQQSWPVTIHVITDQARIFNGSVGTMNHSHFKIKNILPNGSQNNSTLK
jgi:hypothetical protein